MSITKLSFVAPTPWELRIWRLFRIERLNSAEIARYLSAGPTARYTESYICDVIRRVQDFIFCGGHIQWAVNT